MKVQKSALWRLLCTWSASPMPCNSKNKYGPEGRAGADGSDGADGRDDADGAKGDNGKDGGDGPRQRDLAVTRHLALNLLKQEQSVKVGIKAKRKKAAWDHDYRTVPVKLYY